MTRREIDRPATSNRSERPNRIPINGKRGVLDVKGTEEGWHYCWVNDKVGNEFGNIEKYLDAGYEFATHEGLQVGSKKINQASQVGDSKLSRAVGNGITAYLMRVPMEYYKEDYDEIQREVDTSVAGLKKRLNTHTDGSYGSVDIKT